MRPRRRRARPAQVRRPTLPSRRRRRRRRRHSSRPSTPGGGGRAHALAAPCCCAPRARWPARTCVAELHQTPLPTPCSRYKCRGARAWSGWARRGDRACGTTTDTTIPHLQSMNNREYNPRKDHENEPKIIGMGKTAEVAGDGGSPAGDGGAGDARALSGRGRAPRPAAQHTAARRRVRAGRASAVTSPLSASRADQKQFSTSTEQVRERRARVGGRSGRAPSAGRRRRRRRGRGGRQEGRAAAEGYALVGAYGRAAAARLPAGRAAALRHGAAPRSAVAAARRVTSPRLRTSLSYHAYIPLSGRSDSPECTRVPEYYRLGNLFIWDSRAVGGRGRARVLCDMCDRVVL